MRASMRELLISDDGVAEATPLGLVDADVERLGRRFECKVRRFLEAIPLPAKGLGRRRIAHANVVRVHSAQDLRQGVHYTHGVAVLRIAKMPHLFPAMAEPFDL